MLIFRQVIYNCFILHEYCLSISRPRKDFHYLTLDIRKKFLSEVAKRLATADRKAGKSRSDKKDANLHSPTLMPIHTKVSAFSFYPSLHFCVLITWLAEFILIKSNVPK